MKISRMLLTSGVLMRGATPHCKEWDFPSANPQTRFGGSVLIRQAVRRRAKQRQSTGGFWARISGLGRSRGK